MSEKEIELFNQGIICFNNKEYYDAHEYWEELWLNYKLEDAKFVQGLIQLAVSYFHFFNDNLKGAKSMLDKSKLKFSDCSFSYGIDVKTLVSEISKVQKCYNSMSEKLDYKGLYRITLKIDNE